MSLDGIQGMSDTMRSFVQTVRLYMRDHAELNRLIAGEESSDRMIAWAVLDALSDFNSTPPPLGEFTLDDLIQQRQLQSLLLRMTVIALIESVGLLQTRNQLNYSDGGLNVGVNDKTPLLMGWLKYFKATTEQKVGMVKISMNISNLLDGSASGVFSEMWAVNGTYMSY